VPVTEEQLAKTVTMGSPKYDLKLDGVKYRVAAPMAVWVDE